MKLLLLDINPHLCAEWRKAFTGTEDVHIFNGAFEAIIGTYDCLVSPANSFGLMDGGMDFAISAYFGWDLQERVQDEIWQRFRGEQPVGTCLIVPTGHGRCPYLAHCPTMQQPMDVSETSHAYAALLAALTTAEASGIQTLACPGLGTQVGRLPADVAARQMRFAYEMWRAPYRRPTWTSVANRTLAATGRFWPGEATGQL